MTVLWAGIAIGAVYAIVAILYNIILAQTGTFNFAASQPMMIGGFVAFVGIEEQGWPWPLVLLISALVGVVVSVLVELVAIRPLREAGFSVLVTTVGAAVLIQGIAVLIWGADAKLVNFPGSDEPFRLLGGALLPIDVTLLVIAVALGVGLELATHRTRWGAAGRATTEDSQAASLRGINIRWVVVTAFALSGLVAGAVAPLVAAKAYADVTLGTNMVVYGFIALAIGGFGSYLGSLLGGLITGVVQLQIANRVDSSYALLILFGVVLLVLLVRPTGLLGHRSVRVV